MALIQITLTIVPYDVVSEFDRTPCHEEKERRLSEMILWKDSPSASGTLHCLASK
jgi:hypothetical protein